MSDFELLDTAEVGDPQAAGDFASWLASARRGHARDVPCGTCTACCRASYFIHLTPEDTAAREHIPADLLVPAPGLPRGHHVLGYDEHGACPMLVDDRCSIYPYRPQTCRDYDCRIFAVTGIAAGGADKAQVKARTAQWRFTYPAAEDERAQAAVRAAVDFIRARGELFETGLLPTNPTQIALLAIKSHELFVDAERSEAELAQAITELVQAARS